MQNNPIKILTDDEEDQPVLGFEPLGHCIINTIMGSDPKFSIGVYGEWGTGKTTLMKFVERGLENYKPQVLSLWFNAWRYEREENLAITALLKSIAYAMENHPIYGELKPIILRSIKVITKGLISELASKLISREAVNEIREGLEKRSLPYLDLLAEFDKDTIYFDGLNKIESEMAKILKQDKYATSRVVIFIDDLDRCSPRKTLEVFESVKVFLNIMGFVFVIGLSHDSISKLIDAEYKPSGIRGSQYIRKIIQIPIILPEWKSTDVGPIIDNLIKSSKIGSDYSTILTENKLVLESVVEPNPREIKRFINNFIISNELFSGQLGKDIRKQELLVVQALRFRWHSFYTLFSSNEELRMLIREILDQNIRYEYLVKIMNNPELLSAYLDSLKEGNIDTSSVSLPSLRNIMRYRSVNWSELTHFFNLAREDLERIGLDMDTVKERLTSIYDLLRKYEYLNESPANEKRLEEKDKISTETDYQIMQISDMVRKLEGRKSLLESLSEFRDSYSSVLYEMDSDLMKFLREQRSSIYSIVNWDDYRVAAEFSREIPVSETPRSYKEAPTQVANVSVIEGDLERVWINMISHLCHRQSIEPSGDGNIHYTVEDLRLEHYQGFNDSQYFRRLVEELARRHKEIEIDGDLIKLTSYGVDKCKEF